MTDSEPIKGPQETFYQPGEQPQSKYIGIVMGITTHTIYGVMDPGTDYELDNPRLLQVRSQPPEAMTMVKVLRSDYGELHGPDDVAKLAVRYSAKAALEGEPQGGTEYIDPNA